MGVVDQPFPAHGGARLFEIDAHHDVQAIAHLVGQRAEAAGVIQCSIHVMDGAGAHDHQQARVVAIQDVLNDAAAFHDGALGGFGERNGCLQGIGGGENVLSEDVEIANLLIRHLATCTCAMGEKWSLLWRVTVVKINCYGTLH